MKNEGNLRVLTTPILFCVMLMADCVLIYVIHAEEERYLDFVQSNQILVLVVVWARKHNFRL